MGGYFNKSTRVLLFIGLIGLFFCYKSFYFQPHDFANYYFGTHFLSQGDFGEWIYFPHLFNQAIVDLGYDPVFVSYAPNTPFLAQCFLLFSWLDLSTAKLVFNVISLGLFLFSLRKIMAISAINPYYFALIPLVFLLPLRNNFLFGQAYLCLFFLLAEGYLAYRNESFWKMGVFWGLAIGLKVSPIFIVGWLVVQRKWKPLFYLGGIGLLLFAISVLGPGGEHWLFYFQRVLLKSGAGEITTEYLQNYQSFHMLLKGLLPDSPRLFAAVLLGYKLSLLSLAVLFSLREKNELKLIGIWLLTATLITPYGSTYSLLMLIFVAAYLFTQLGQNNRRYWLAVIFLLLACNLPVQFFVSLPIPLNFPRFFLLAALLCVLVYPLIDRRWMLKTFGVVCLLVLLNVFLKPNKTQVYDPFLIENQPLLVYDYGVENGKLTYTYWTDDGSATAQTDLIVNSLVFTTFDFQTTHESPSTSFLKPAILNDTTMIYLSDEKRGIGFYALHFRQLEE